MPTVKPAQYKPQLVYTPSDLPLDTYMTEVVYAGAASVATRQKKVPPANTVRVTISVQKVGGATAISDGAFIVFNAATDGDANLSLQQEGRVYVRMDKSRTINFSSKAPVTRVDVIPEASLRSTPANETGGFIINLEFGAT